MFKQGQPVPLVHMGPSQGNKRSVSFLPRTSPIGPNDWLERVLKSGTARVPEPSLTYNGPGRLWGNSRTFR